MFGFLSRLLKRPHTPPPPDGQAASMPMPHDSSAAPQSGDIFHARHAPELWADMLAVLTEGTWMSTAARARYPALSAATLTGIGANARLAIAYITTAQDDYSQKGNTRFFGLPDLPPGVEYPRVDAQKKAPEGNLYKFIAQINCAELSGMQEYFPKRGILYFFVKSVWLPLEENFPHLVFYYDGDTESLTSALHLGIRPQDIFDVYHDYDSPYNETPFRVRIAPFVSILNDEEGVNEGYYVEYPPAIEDAPLSELNQALQARLNIHHEMELFSAHSQDVHTTNAQIRHMHDDGPYVQAAKALGGKPEDYVILLNTDSYGADADELYFVIAKDRLKALDFSRVYCRSTWWD